MPKKKNQRNIHHRTNFSSVAVTETDYNIKNDLSVIWLIESVRGSKDDIPSDTFLVFVIF